MYTHENFHTYDIHMYIPLIASSFRFLSNDTPYCTVLESIEQ